MLALLSLFLIVVLFVGFAITLFVRNRRMGLENPRARWWLLVGLPLGWLSVSTPYSYSEEYEGIGLPMIAAFFEVESGADFVSPLTPAILVFDFLVVTLIPYSLVIIWRSWMARRSAP